MEDTVVDMEEVTMMKMHGMEVDTEEDMERVVIKEPRAGEGTMVTTMIRGTKMTIMIRGTEEKTTIVDKVITIHGIPRKMRAIILNLNLGIQDTATNPMKATRTQMPGTSLIHGVAIPNQILTEITLARDRSGMALEEIFQKDLKA